MLIARKELKFTSSNSEALLAKRPRWYDSVTFLMIIRDGNVQDGSEVWSSFEEEVVLSTLLMYILKKAFSSLYYSLRL